MSACVWLCVRVCEDRWRAVTEPLRHRIPFWVHMFCVYGFSLRPTVKHHRRCDGQVTCPGFNLSSHPMSARIGPNSPHEPQDDKWYRWWMDDVRMGGWMNDDKWDDDEIKLTDEDEDHVDHVSLTDSDQWWILKEKKMFIMCQVHVMIHMNWSVPRRNQTFYEGLRLEPLHPLLLRMRP